LPRCSGDRRQSPRRDPHDDTWLVIISLAAATIRVAVPLVLAALGRPLCERSGIVDIGLEGKMAGGQRSSPPRPRPSPLGLARPRRRHRRVGGAGAGPRGGERALQRQPGGLRHGDQHPGRRADAHPRQRLVHQGGQTPA